MNPQDSASREDRSGNGGAEGTRPPLMSVDSRLPNPWTTAPYDEDKDWRNRRDSNPQPSPSDGEADPVSASVPYRIYWHRQGDSNPRLRTENATSWATRR